MYVVSMKRAWKDDSK